MSPPTFPTLLRVSSPRSIELVRVGKTHDQATWNVALGTFSLPNAATWFEGNFSSQHVAQLSQDYPKVRMVTWGTFRGCLPVTSM